VDSANSYNSFCINTALYLPYLESQCLANGVKFKRANLEALAPAANLHHSGNPAALIVNCTGLSVRNLAGLGPDGTGDKLVYPVRGQVVLVRNELDSMIELTASHAGTDEMTYVMTRAAGGGTILGGCSQENNWDPLPDLNLAQRIMTKAVELCPALGNGQGIAGLDIVRHAAGLRPVRTGGTRVGATWVDNVLVVHNYGHGGFGYQSSYGCSQDVVKVIKDVLADNTDVLEEKIFFENASAHAKNANER
jgi:D-amino-acid oxidase